MHCWSLPKVAVWITAGQLGVTGPRDVWISSWYGVVLSAVLSADRNRRSSWFSKIISAGWIWFGLLGTLLGP